MTEGIGDLFFTDAPLMDDANGLGDQDEILSQRLQAPPLPGASSALQEDNTAFAELEDVPMAAAKKRRSINRGPKLDTKRLLSSRGLPAIPTYFEKVKLQGKGHEAEDLNAIMSNLEHWAHRLYPKLTFDDCLEKIETLGHKKEIQTCLKKIRMGMPIMDEDFQSTVITADGPTMEDDPLSEVEDDANAENVAGGYLNTEFESVSQSSAQPTMPEQALSLDQSSAEQTDSIFTFDPASQDALT